MKRFTFLLFVLLPILSVQAQEAGIDVQHYALQITLSDASNVIGGEARIDVEFTEPSDGFALDLISRQSALSKKGMAVESVTRDGAAISFTHEDDRLHVSVDPPAPAGAVYSYTIQYEGEPVDGLIISTNKFGDRTFFGDNWPNRARNWIPSVDHPSDKATFEFAVSAPDHYQIVGTGRLVEETDLEDGQRLTHWATEVPIPTKVAVIGVARFAIEHTGYFKNIPIQAWVYPQDRKAGFHDFSVTALICSPISNAKSDPFPTKSWPTCSLPRGMAGWKTPPISSTMKTPSPASNATWVPLPTRLRISGLAIR